MSDDESSMHTSSLQKLRALFSNEQSVSCTLACHPPGLESCLNSSISCITHSLCTAAADRSSSNVQNSRTPTMVSLPASTCHATGQRIHQKLGLSISQQQASPAINQGGKQAITEASKQTTSKHHRQHTTAQPHNVTGRPQRQSLGDPRCLL